ncbi:MAG: substrate-binding domain-containing protein, partial [Chloroflexota bacterium]
MTTRFERRQTILRLLREQPGIKVTHLAELLDVSTGTIRNDLNALEAQQQVKRVYGGAVLVEPVLDEYPWVGGQLLGRQDVENADAKQRIGRWAAEMVEEGDAIFMDASTTVQHMIPHLSQFRRLTIVTNGLDTAGLLSQHSAHSVILVGGLVGTGGHAITREMGLDILENLHMRTAFISGVGFSARAGLTERNIDEARLKRAILSRVRQIVALVDSSKLDKEGLAPVLGAERLGRLYTDSDVSEESLSWLREMKVNLVVCGQNTVRSYLVHDQEAKYVIGFANQSEQLPFAVDVRRGLERAVKDVNNVDLIVADNALSAERALHIADQLIRREVDLAIEYQIDFKTGSLIMDKFKQADIPVIAVDIPMVGATYFGVDNYRAGHMAGVGLGEWLQEQWQGRFDLLLVLEESRAGSLPEARIQGQLDGLEEVVGPVREEKKICLESANTSSVSEAQIAKTLEAHPDSTRVAIICFNDDAAIGALRAARRLGREEDVVIVGQGADRMVRDELRKPGSRIIGSTAYRPEQYGEKLLQLALKVLNGESVPPAVYMNHVFITAENVDDCYPVSAQS